MKTILFSIAAALAISSMSVAQAQDTSIPIQAEPARHTVMQEDFADLTDAYKLANGQILKFTENGGRYFTQLDKGKRVELSALSRGEFVTADGAKLIFSDDGHTVGVDNFEKLPMAAKLPANTTMMMARR